mgnify:CR=1 FL=1
MAITDQAVSRRERVQLNSSSAPPAVKVAYIMSRFPKLSETFVLYEMLALQQQGVDVEVFPLINERAKVVHDEAKPFVERAHYLPVLSLPATHRQEYQQQFVHLQLPKKKRWWHQANYH